MVTDKVAEDLPINHHQCLPIGLWLVEWQHSGRARLYHGPLCWSDWSQTESAAFLCESLLSSDLFHFTFSFSPRSFLLAFSTKYFCLKRVNPLKQTSQISPGLPRCQVNIYNSGCYCWIKKIIKLLKLILQLFFNLIEDFLSPLCLRLHIPLSLSSNSLNSMLDLQIIYLPIVSFLLHLDPFFQTYYEKHHPQINVRTDRFCSHKQHSTTE